ncbi:MAG: membrane protein insertion efficiency factor YidD [Oscillatoriaceae cyanobacterium Prado104]|jgi:putative component of membrane protein insertase Oxa1/YidC/SpoIIIJ protein YidD|nr:membrane protein insertion efficiency factor YidD [Oscillatoriaceae cyanobacterium Prado104]
MQTSSFDAAIRQLAIASISGYQKHISPKKGFCCAHRVLYGGESCSQYVKGAIAKFGLFEVLKASRRRFAACKQANQILKARCSSQSDGQDSNFEGEEIPKPTSDNPRRNSNCPNQCADALAALSCDVPFEVLDCGAADCSGIDCCSVADFGSCF